MKKLKIYLSILALSLVASVALTPLYRGALEQDWVRSAWAAAARGKSTTVILSDTSETTIHAFEPARNRFQARGTVHFFHSTQAGTVRVYYINPAGTNRLITSQSATANTLMTIDFDFAFPEGEISFEADTSPATVDLESFQY